MKNIALKKTNLNLSKLKIMLVKFFKKLRVKNPKLRLIRFLVLLGLIVTIIVLLLRSTMAQAGWYDQGWAYRKRLDFNNSAQATNLTNFPVMVKLTSSNFDFLQAKSDGADIRFTDSDGTTLLKYEIEKWDSTANEAIIWVNVPQIDASSSTDHIYVYWGNQSASDAQDADNTWNSNYKGVWHLNDNTSNTTVTDSTSNTNDITSFVNTNSNGISQTGKIGNGIFMGDNPTVITSPSLTTDDVTASIALDANGFPVIAYKDNTNFDLVIVRCNDKECKGDDESIQVPVTTGDTGTQPSIVLDENSYPVVSYYDTTNTDLYLLHCNDLYCAGGDESNVGVDTGANALGLHSIVRLDSSTPKKPVIAYHDDTNQSVKLAYCGDANCSSGNTLTVVEDTASNLGSGYKNIDFVIRSNGYPIITYYDTTNTKMRVASCNNATCSSVTINQPVSTASHGLQTAIEINGSDIPLIAYMNGTAGVAYIKCSDTACSGIDAGMSSAPVTISSSSAIDYMDMSKSASGYPIIVTSGAGSFPTLYHCSNELCGSISNSVLAGTLKIYYSYYPQVETNSAGDIAVVDYGNYFYGLRDVRLFTAQAKYTDAYDSDFNFGTGNFSTSMWFKSVGDSRQEYLLSRYDADQGFIVRLNYAGQACFGIDDDSSLGPDDIACSSNSLVTSNVDAGNVSTVEFVTIRQKSNGNPTIIYDDEGSDDLELIDCTNATCSTSNFKSIDATGDIGDSFAMELSTNDYPRIAYRDATNLTLKYIGCTSTNCASDSPITLDNTANVGSNPSLKLDADGNPVIVYYDTTNTAVKFIHCNDPACNSSVDSSPTLNPDETPRIIRNVGSDQVSAGSDSLALDANGYPMIAHYDATGADMEYLHCTDINCSGSITTKTIESTGSIGSYYSISKNASGNPVIVYYDASNLRLRLATCNDTDCSSPTINTITNTNSMPLGWYQMHLTFNSSNNPVIFTTSLTQFKYAYIVCNDALCAGGDENISYLRSTTSTGYIYGEGFLDSSDYPVIAYHDSSDLKLYKGDNATTITENGSYDDGNWHHLAAVKSGTSSIRIYIDGVEVGSDTSIAATGTLTSDSAALTIGQYNVNSVPGGYVGFGGYIDEVQIDNTARSADWVKAQYLSESNNFINVASTELRGRPILWYALDEGQGQTINNGIAGAVSGTLGADTNVASDDPTWITDRAMCVSGGCLQFDGTNDYINVASNVADVKSVSFWVRLNTTTEYFIDLNGSAYIQASGGTISATGFSSPTIYVDGVVKNTIEANKWQHIEVTTATAINASAIRVGRISSNYLQGFIDEIKFYSYTRSANQVKQDYTTVGVGSIQGSSASFGGGNVSEKLSEGLVGYWKMDEAAANTCSGGVNDSCDSSGNVLDGAWNGNATSANGKFGNGIIYDGSSAYVTVADTAILEPADEYTASVWVNPTGDYSDYNVLLSKGTSSGRSYYIDLRSTTGYVYANSLINNTQYAVSSDFSLDAGTWSFILLSYDGSTLRLYINGELVDSVSANGPVTYNSYGLGLGRWHSSNGDYLSGSLDEVRIYNRALSEGEVRSLYNWAPGPVGYWDFNENTGTTANDRSGNGNTGTLTNSPTWSAGKFGSALNFNGASKRVTIATPVGASGETTLSLWYKRSESDASSTWRTLAGDISANIHHLISRSTTRNLGIWDGSFKDFGYSPPNDGNWHHYLVVYTSGSSAKLYVDGVYINQIATTLDLTTNPIGSVGNWSSGTYFAGPIDDVKIYNYARTPAQIVEDMNAGHPAPGSPVGSATSYFKFDEGYGTTAYDSSINANNLTLSSASWTNSGKLGKAWNGTNAVWLSRADDSDFDFDATSPFAFSFWFKSDSASNPGTTEYLINKANATTAGYAVYATTSGTICIGIDDDATWSPDVSSCTPTDIYDGTWHHIIATRDVTADTTNIYVDGILKDSDNDSTSATLENSLSFYVGDRDGTNNGDEFAGDIDELKIYRFALNQDQVRVEYNQGKAQVLGSTGIESDGKTASFSASREYCVPGDTSSCSAPVGEWKFDENTGTTSVYDTSGNGNTGTMQGSMTTSDWVPGKIGSALDFDGTDDRITASSISGLTSTQTKSAWIYPRSFSVGMNYYVIDEGSNNNWVQLYDSDSDGLPIIRAGFQGGQFVDTSYELPSANRWYYLAITSTSNNITIYLDGVQMATGTKTSQTPGSITIADYGGTGYRFRGVIDQIRIYNYVRTPAQIAWEYNRGAPVAWYKFDECQGTTAYNSAKNGNGDAAGNNGIISAGDATGSNDYVGTCAGSAGEMWADGATGKIGSSLEFDGTNDYVDNFSIPTQTGPNKITVAGWIKPDASHDGRFFTPHANGTDNWISFYLDKLRVYYTETTDVNNRSLFSTNTVPLNQWTHFAVSIDDKTIKIYLNGNLDAEVVDTIDIGNWSGLFTIGRRGALSQNYFSGQIDDVRIYNYALTEAQVKEVYNDGAVSFK